MKTILLFFVVCLAFSSCISNTQPSEFVFKANPKLEFLWQTDSVMTMCEAVKFDAERGVIYVSNINENPWEKDGDGFISKLDTTGRIIELKWITGLDGPKGLGIFQNVLYIADIDHIVEVDIEKGVILKKHFVPDSPKLNDITVGNDGTVYISNSAANIVYALSHDSVRIAMALKYHTLNGLLAEADSLYFLTNQTHELGKVDVETMGFRMLSDSLGHGDGIESIGNGDYLVSNWNGEVFYIHKSDWSKEVILDTKDSEIQAADIGFIQKSNMLIVPTFFHNRVVAYQLTLE